MISDENWQIGDPGSVRELATILALATKTTTDLIQDLVPFGSDVKSVTYNTIKNGTDVAQTINAYQNHEIRFWVDAGLTLSSDLNPTLRTLDTLKDLGENIQEMTDLRVRLNEARRTYAEQLQILGDQLSKLRSRLDQFEEANHDRFVDNLLKGCNASKSTCERVAQEDAKKAASCAQTWKAFIFMMCWGDKGAELDKCLKTADELCAK
jgi:phospholipase/lecithinase/hemolysin